MNGIGAGCARGVGREPIGDDTGYDYDGKKKEEPGA